VLRRSEMYDVGIRPSYDRSVSSIFTLPPDGAPPSRAPAVGADGVTRVRVISVLFVLEEPRAERCTVNLARFGTEMYKDNLWFPGRQQEITCLKESCSRSSRHRRIRLSAAPEPARSREKELDPWQTTSYKRPTRHARTVDKAKNALRGLASLWL
jgi:hypothetical protein